MESSRSARAPRLTPGQVLARLLWIGGRSSRLEWWLVHGTCAVTIAINNELLLEPVTPTIAGVVIQKPMLYWLIVDVVALWVSFTSIARRLHDRNKSAWWCLLYPWPIIGWAWFVIECGFLPGRAAPPEPPQPTGLVRRMQRRPWTWQRIARAAGIAVDLTLLALFLYKWLFDSPPPPTFEAVRQHYGSPDGEDS